VTDAHGPLLPPDVYAQAGYHTLLERTPVDADAGVRELLRLERELL
jgi:hypothetical protein